MPRPGSGFIWTVTMNTPNPLRPYSSNPGIAQPVDADNRAVLSHFIVMSGSVFSMPSPAGDVTSRRNGAKSEYREPSTDFGPLQGEP